MRSRLSHAGSARCFQSASHLRRAITCPVAATSPRMPVPTGIGVAESRCCGRNTAVCHRQVQTTVGFVHQPDLSEGNVGTSYGSGDEFFQQACRATTPARRRGASAPRSSGQSSYRTRLSKRLSLVGFMRRRLPRGGRFVEQIGSIIRPVRFLEPRSPETGFRKYCMCDACGHYTSQLARRVQKGLAATEYQSKT